jgi:hypothetical protein
MSEDTVKVIQFDNASMSMDKCIRMIIENMFDYDNDEGTLTATINEGKDNEAEVQLYLKITSINGTKLEEVDDNE